MRRLHLVTTLFVMFASIGVASAYPQFQLARDQTCTSCHISPDGAGLLNENGRSVAETISWKGMNPDFMYGKVSTPDWLELGGDLRGAAGFVDPGFASAAAYPMQVDMSGHAETHGFSANAVVGFRSYNGEATPLHVIWPREHYVMWQQHPGENEGLYIRAGHLMPTYGLRLAEHVVYTQRFGGKPLFHEAYALAASYVRAAYEVHATGFVHDPYGEPAEKGDGAALYAELRIGERAAVGVEGKLSSATDVTAKFGGVTGKLYIPGVDTLLLGEAEIIQRDFDADRVRQLAAYVMATHALPSGLQLDVGVGHFTQDTRVKGLYRDCVDANLHWYTTSHVELLLTTRLELVDGASGPNGGYALAQLHYRL
jgi:hypothetical protein